MPVNAKLFIVCAAKHPTTHNKSLNCNNKNFANLHSQIYSTHAKCKFTVSTPN